MATPTMALQLIRRARRGTKSPSSEHFERYRGDYRRLLEEVAAIDGEAGVDAVTEWIIDRTRETGNLPSPESVRRRARHVCETDGASIPDGSILESPLA